MNTPLLIFLAFCMFCAALLLFALIRGASQSKMMRKAAEEREKEIA